MNLPELHPDAARRLLDYQGTPARQLFRALQCGCDEWGYPGGVDLSDVGTGKSYMDTAVAVSTGRAPIVLCPVVGQEGWRKCFAHFGREPRFIGTYEAVRGGWRPEIGKFEGRFFKWRNASDSVLILDEAQKVKGNDTMTTAAVGGAIMDEIPIIAASATLASSPLDMRIAGRITGLHEGGADWKRFLRQNGCWLDEQEVPPRWRFNPRFSACLDEINSILIPARGCRVKKADMGPQPGTTILPLPLDCPEAAELSAAWEELNEKIAFMKSEPKRFPREVVQNTYRAGRMKLWKRCEMALVKPVAERVRACLDEGKSVVVFFNFTPCRLAMGKLLKTKAGFYGGQTAKQRAAWEAEFQANTLHLLLCNIKAAGASVNLHDIHGERVRETFIFPSDRPDVMGQAPGRVDRQGGKSHSTQWIPHINSGFMASLVKSTMQKMKRMDTFNNGSGQRRLPSPTPAGPLSRRPLPRHLAA